MDETGTEFLRNLQSQSGKPAEKKPIEVMRGDTLLSMKIEAIPMLFEGLIPQVGLIAEVGPSDVGKSMLLRQLAMCCAKGEDFLCFPYKGRYRNAIYISTEDDSRATSFLLRRQNGTMKLSDAEAHNIRFIYNFDDIVEAVREQLSIEPTDIVILDAFGDIFTGRDMKDNTQVRKFMNDFKNIADEFQTCIAFLHHTGKRTEDLVPSKNNSIGSQSFEAKCRLVVEFRADAKENDIRHLCIVKGNYLPPEAKRNSYVLRIDSNFCFEWTGGRRPFEELAKEQFMPSRRAVDAVDENKHKEFLSAFLDMPKTKNQMNQIVCDTFHVSDKTARSYIDMYISKGWIKDVSNGNYPARYEYYVDNLPF